MNKPVIIINYDKFINIVESMDKDKQFKEDKLNEEIYTELVNVSYNILISLNTLFKEKNNSKINDFFYKENSTEFKDSILDILKSYDLYDHIKLSYKEVSNKVNIDNPYRAYLSLVQDEGIYYKFLMLYNDIMN